MAKLKHSPRMIRRLLSIIQKLLKKRLQPSEREDAVPEVWIENEKNGSEAISPDGKASRELKKHADTVSKRIVRAKQRDRSRKVPIDPAPESLRADSRLVDPGHERFILAKDLLDAVAAKLFQVMEVVFAGGLLSPLLRDTIVHHYHLDAHFPREVDPTARSPSAYRQNLYAGRREFNRALESELRLQLESATSAKREVVELALEIVAGARMQEFFDRLEELYSD